jgi:adenine-specific DNA-methyltransferase
VAKEESAIDDHAHSDDKGTYFKGRELLKWGAGSMRSDRETMWFSLTAPDGSSVWPIRNDGKEGRWRMGEGNKYIKSVRSNPDEAHWERRPFDSGVKVDGATERWVPYAKVREESKESVFGSWLDSQGSNADGTEELKRIFGFKVFDTPKPVSLYDWLLSLCPNDDAVVLDSFAGSGTTAHAVLKRNADDGGTRRFILVQLPEEVKADSEAGRHGYKEIVDITAARVRRVIRGYDYTGTQATDLHPPEKVTWTAFSRDKRRNQILERIEAIKTLDGANYDQIETKITDGVLTVLGQKQVKETMHGLAVCLT